MPALRVYAGAFLPMTPRTTDSRRSEGTACPPNAPLHTGSLRAVQDEHHGNIVTYLRMKGIVPPSSERR